MANQDYFLSVRLKPDDQRKLEALCETSGLPASTVVRELISGTEIKSRRPMELKELYLAVNRIGVNVNQIARKANAGFATRSDMRELLFLMRKIEEKMSRIAEA